MCTRRYGKDGLNTICHQSAGRNWPSAVSEWPCGVCIQEFAARIQNALIKRADRHQKRGDEVDAASDTLPAEQQDTEEPGFQEERRHHLVTQQRADHAPVLSEKRAQLVPNWYAMTTPETTPMPNVTANTRSQYWKTSR